MTKLTIEPLTLALGVYGFTPEQVGAFTIPEGIALLEKLNERHEAEFKEQAVALHVHASELASMIGQMLTDEKHRKELPQLWDIYPGLFEEQKSEYIAKRLEAEYERRKADADDRRFYAAFEAQRKAGIADATREAECQDHGD